MSEENELKEQIRINKALKKHLKDAVKTIDMLSDDLQDAKEHATAYRVNWENLEASLPKVRADAFIDGATWERESRFHKDIETEAEAYAIKLEQGNE